LFDRAVDLEVYKDSGLMRSIVCTSDGRLINWRKSPRWYSVTRSCRAILDLNDTEDRKKAEMLEGRIRKMNPGFNLLAGLT
jgi:hypothetical protein